MRTFFLFLSLVAGSAGAADLKSALALCKEVTDEKRLACFDEATKDLGPRPDRETYQIAVVREKIRQEEAHWKKPTGSPNKPSTVVKAEDTPLVRIKLRDSGTVSAVGQADLGSKPAVFQVGRTDGTNYTTAKVAAIGVFRSISEGGPDGAFYGWEPFAGASWDRDTSAKSPKDLRQGFFGLTGEALSPKAGDRNGLGLLVTVRGGYRDEIRKQQSGAFGNLHVDAIYFPFVDDPEVAGRNAKSLVPFAGLLSSQQRTSPSASDDGTFSGVYAGAKLEVKLGAIAERLSATATGQFYKDLRAPDSERRFLRFGTIGLKYDLVDPQAKTGWVPSLSLTWQRGTEPVTGEGPGRKVLAALGVKYD